jgi:hypothetical protein
MSTRLTTDRGWVTLVEPIHEANLEGGRLWIVYGDSRYLPLPATGENLWALWPMVSRWNLWDTVPTDQAKEK